MLVSIVADVTMKDDVFTVIVDPTTITDGLKEALEEARQFLDGDPEDLEQAEYILNFCRQASAAGIAQYIYWEIR